MKCSVVAMVFTSMLLAAGILLILIPCIQYDNWWPLLTIFVLSFAIMIPVVCGGCSQDGFDPNDDLALISWVFVGIFGVTGYAIPALLLRGKYIPETGLLFAFAGGTTIIVSILVFVRTIYFKKDSSMAYIL